MNKGRIITKAILARLSLSAAALLLCVPVAQAQQGNPEVYIDMGALPGVGGNAPAAPRPIKLKPPAPRPAHEQGFAPRLTAPSEVVSEQPPAPAPAPVNMQPKPVIATPQKVTPLTPVTPPPAVVKKKTEAARPPVQPTAKPSVPKTIKPQTVSKSPDMPPDKLPLQAAPPPLVSPPVMPPVAPAPVAITPTVFPVETRVRVETNDPTDSESSRPVPVRSGDAVNQLDTVVPSRPLPDMDPAASAPTQAITAAPAPEPPEPEAVTPATIKTVTGKAPPLVPLRKPQTSESNMAASPAKVRIDAVHENAPSLEAVAAPSAVAKAAEAKPQVPPLVPARRPNFVEKAPAELVAELRAREAAREIEESAKAAGNDDKKKRTIDLSDPPPPPGPRGQKNMPAVKKAAVESETIAEQVVKLPAKNDPLLDSLVEKDKESLVATIESMVAAREDGKALPAPASPKREPGSNIVKAEPMQRPYSVYRPNKKSDENTQVASLPPETAAAITEKPAEVVEPVAKNGPRPPKPQAQDEQAYVSVPFSEGLTEINSQITGEIEKRILPILNQNPAWKLQIQAFASPVKDGASSARKASLARALSVRTYLLGKGIDATRMDVRALGAESDRDPMDRVDLIVFDPAKKG